MKDIMSAMDLHFMVQELQILQHAKIMKIFQHDEDKNLLCLQVHAPGKGKFFVNIVLPGLLYLSQQKFKFPQTPPGFCGFLRKYLNNARIREIRQVGFERILEFVIEGLNEKFILVVELFSTGNVLLCYEDYNIKGLLYTQRWDARTVRGGVKYEYPPALLNPFNIKEDELQKKLAESDLDIVRFCAIELSLGGFYAERLLQHVNIEKDVFTKDVDAKKLFDGLQKLLHEPLAPCKKDGHVSPVEIKEWETCETFSEALNSVYANKYEKEEYQEQEKTHQKHVSKYEKIVKEQTLQIENSQKEIEINSAKGDVLYAHYMDVSSLLQELHTLRKTKTWDEIKEIYKDHSIVKNIDETKGLITVELE